MLGSVFSSVKFTNSVAVAVALAAVVSGTVVVAVAVALDAAVAGTVVVAVAVVDVTGAVVAAVVLSVVCFHLKKEK